MKVTNFDKPTIKVIRLAMEKALAEVGEEYGVKISAGNATYTEDEVTFKVKANTIGSNGTVQSKEASNWSLYAPIHGLGSLSVGDEVKLQGKTFTIAGWNTRAKKSPINIDDSEGKGYKCSVDMVKVWNNL